MTTKSHSICSAIFLFLFGIFSSTLFSKEQYSPPTKVEEAIINAVVSYLKEHSLSPYFSGGKCEYAHLGFMKDSYNNNTHALGMIEQGDSSCISLFSIEKSWYWHEVKAALVYLTTDEPISPTLFEDISRTIISSSEKDLTFFHVLIEKQDSNAPQGSKLQKWIFFNDKESEEVFVVLTDDGRGGTYFKIIPF